jgi:predicted lipoprotein with Yx(FWY)xxD motif
VGRIYFAVGALALVAVLAIVGCGGGGGSSSSSTESEPATSKESATTESEPATSKESATTAGEPKEEAAVVKVTDTDLGKVIVDAAGMTMYDFHKDKGTTPSCYGACAEAWPPLLTEGKPTAAGGAEAPLLGVTKRKDGTEQVTYAGHPLYGFIEDRGPGETNGNDVDAFGAEWYALMPNGEEPEDG